MSVRDHAGDLFLRFVSAIPKGSCIAIIGHSDVDGLAATVIATRTFQHLGCSVWPYVTCKGENAWSEGVLNQASAQHPAGLAVVDLGSRGDVLLPDVPAVLIDHHKPTGVPHGATLISGYGAEPTPSSGLLAFWCAQAVGCGKDLAWLAAMSMLADYGKTDGFPELKGAAGVTALRRATTLLNAPRRTSTGDANAVLQVLLQAANVAAVLAPENEEVLLAAKAEVDSAFARARKSAPKFAGDVALILVDEGCQVHPLVAQTWRARLRDHVVICANTGYLPGRVNFAARTATSRNLLDFLQEHRPAGAGEDYGRGHDKATGGSLSVEDWAVFLRSLGFTADVPPAS